ncbi:hypothetical protein BDQ94DRAFT_52082 [Aspergillus welwitschiae]|uniref:Uncharacterized protein n=1 Tax=Aspergillus welwitschiae TaxID=1341132 RepID=A0A3F3PZM9_9EURO|nr:hypothetical protein BDQ94DRAFT_52082 [Aspergillus welwitschiae]RDH31836.1 hypothetical protein BDQ94DRAFT_52082 [Aspergillus welwitschiae]
MFVQCFFHYLAHILLSRDEHIIQNLPARADLPAFALFVCLCSVPVFAYFPLFIEHRWNSLCINLMCVDRAASRVKLNWQTTWKARDHTVLQTNCGFFFSPLYFPFPICPRFSDYLYFFTPHSALFPPTNTLFDPPPGLLCAVSGEVGWPDSTDKVPIHKGPCQVLPSACQQPGFPFPPLARLDREALSFVDSSAGLPRFFFDVRSRQDGIFVPSRYLTCLPVHAGMCL